LSPEVVRLGGQTLDCTHHSATAFAVINNTVVATAPRRAHIWIFNCVRALAGRGSEKAINDDYGVEFYPGPPRPADVEWFEGIPRTLGAMRAGTIAGRVWQGIDVDGQQTSVLSFWVRGPQVEPRTLKLIADALDLQGRTVLEFLDSEHSLILWPRSPSSRTPAGLPTSPDLELEVPPEECGRYFGAIDPLGPRTLVLADIHHRIHLADFWVTHVRAQAVVMLGDVFDAHNDSPEDARRTATWLKEKLRDPRFICLWSNHDLVYGLPGHEVALHCPGFSAAKAKAIRAVLKREDWKKMKVACMAEGWLLSHAGFHPAWGESTLEGILARCAVAERLAARGQVDPILAQGIPPGLGRFAGPIWQDFSSALPIKGIRQLVGHTADENVRIKHLGDGVMACIDVHNVGVAAILCQGQLRVIDLDSFQGTKTKR
jgi:hypothetical protein